MADKWRLIINDTKHPIWNMAVDEALLHFQTVTQSAPVLRFYTWDRAALSIGHFQKPDDIPLEKMKELDIFPVSRITGGAAVLHGSDLTYSVAAGVGGQLPRGVVASCQYICRGIIEGLKVLGVEAEFGRELSSRSRAASCFIVFAPTDIICQGRKMVGSAQHRKGESLLQHGSIVLRDNTYLLEQLFGDPFQGSIALEQILMRAVTEVELRNALKTGFEKALGIELKDSVLYEQEKEMARQLAVVIKNRWPY